VKAISGKQLARLLEQHGWLLLRVQGSHHIYGKAGSVARISIPIHGNQPLKIGLLKYLLKVAGLSDADLFDL
jgi:predicted RNA binding protein YcfA (HicA-like mRNA interferase family)